MLLIGKNAAMGGADPQDSCKLLFKQLRMLSLSPLYIFKMCDIVEIQTHLLTPKNRSFFNPISQRFGSMYAYYSMLK